MKARSESRDRGTGSIFKRGKILRIRYYRHGKGFSETTGSDNMTKARDSGAAPARYVSI
jgi:hypothetical protein